MPRRAGTSAAEPGATGSAAAERRTLAYAGELLGQERLPHDRDAVNEVVEAMSHPGATGLSEQAFGEVLGRVGVGDLCRHPAGEGTLALLIIEHELTLRFHGGQADVGAMADALSAYLVACNRSSAALEGRQRVVQSVEEFLARRRLPRQARLTVAVQTLSEAQRADWERLAQAAAWLRWLTPEQADPPAGVPVDAPGLVDLMVLLRPRQQQRYDGEGVTVIPLPERFSRLYRPTDWKAAPDLLQQLADALDPLLHSPARTAQMVQGLQLPKGVRAAVTARVDEEIGHVEDPQHLLMVRVDDATSARVVLVNLSPQYTLQFRLAGSAFSLPPNAVEQYRATDYCCEPRRVQVYDRIEIGGRQVSLDVPRPDLAQNASITTSTIPPELFRGREEQLSMLQWGIGGRGPRPGYLIFGARRAGKSTLMEHAALDGRLHGCVSIDVANTSSKVRDYGAWSREVSRALVRASRRLPGISLQPDDDFLQTLIDLDDALEGGPPVALCLDELDQLLLPEQKAEGRRAAGRLGNQTFSNLLVMGTVQRFHRSVHEFKNWQMIECPVDLSWADGVTYFFGPLNDPRLGPRREWPERAAVAPQLFASDVEPLIGLRPYFWGRLRMGLEAVVGTDPAQSRLVEGPLLRRELAKLVTQDPHLEMVTETAEELGDLDLEELRRRDLLSEPERAVLVLFARLPVEQDTVRVKDAERVGSREAVEELIDRAYLSHTTGGTRLRTAVPIFQQFLRSRVRVLEALTDRTQKAPSSPPAALLPSAGPASTAPASVPASVPARVPARVPATAATTVHLDPADRPALPEGVTEEDIHRIRQAVEVRVSTDGRLAMAELGELVRKVSPAVVATRYAGTKRLAQFVAAFLPDYPRRVGSETPGGGYLEARGQDTAPEGRPAALAAAVSPTPKDLPASPKKVPSAPKKAPSAKANPAKAAAASAAPTRVRRPQGGMGRSEPFADQPEPLPAKATTQLKPARTVLAAPVPAAAMNPVDLERVRAALLAELSDKESIPLSAAGLLIKDAAPHVRNGSRWGDQSSLTQFFEVHLRDFGLVGSPQEREVRAPVGNATVLRGLRRLFLRLASDAPPEARS